MIGFATNPIILEGKGDDRTLETKFEADRLMILGFGPALMAKWAFSLLEYQFFAKITFDGVHVVHSGLFHSFGRKLFEIETFVVCDQLSAFENLAEMLELYNVTLGLLFDHGILQNLRNDGSKLLLFQERHLWALKIHWRNHY